MKMPSYDSELQCVKVAFSGYPTLEEFQEVANPIIDELKASGAHKVLNDITELVVNSEEIQDWTQTDWFPRAYQAGMTHFAFLMPESAFGQVSAEQTNAKAEEDALVEIKYFGNEQEAHAWLASV